MQPPINTYKIDIIAGARPNFVTVAALIKAMESLESPLAILKYRLIHTGQHYGGEMSDSFFSQLNLPEPDVFLNAGSGTHAEQTSAIMIGYEKALEASPCDLCIVVGDVNSTMACAIVAQKMAIPLAHVEAGIRSGDKTMPEEVNRLITDSITDYFFTTSDHANQNLLASGVAQKSIFHVGNTMIDTLLANRPRFCQPACWEELGLSTGNYFLLTAHRPVNVDDSVKLKQIIEAIAEASPDLPIVFPVHPRTQKALQSLELPPNVHLMPPLPYLEFNFLLQNAKGVLTDSGGISEEATVLGIPCCTLRTTTERPETVLVGTNRLVGSDPLQIKEAVTAILNDNWKKGERPYLWDGDAAKRIVTHLFDILAKRE